jgi:N-acyl-D-amino-acid deacylase
MSQPVSRRKFLESGGRAALGFAVLPFSSIRFSPSFDIVIRGATVLDGTGAPAWQADIGIVGDTITAIGSIGAEQGRRVIEAAGLHLAPGFVDIHSHSDDSIFRYPSADSRVLQGITTEVTGNCGNSAAPLVGAALEKRQARMAQEGVKAGWSSVRSYLDAVEAAGPSVNQALLVGQGTMRQSVAGLSDRHLTPGELDVVLRLLEDCLDEGAFGLSTGLEYTPGRFTSTEEIVAMVRVVARRGALYASHVRNEETMVLEALNEAIETARESGARLQISHLKAAGRPNWGKQRAALDLIEGARRAGVDVLADAYPYTAYSTGLTIFLPAWALDGGWPELARRFDDAEARRRIRAELIERVRQDPGDYDLIVISSVRTERNRTTIGRNMEEVASGWGMEPADALIRLLVEEEGSVGFIGHGMSAENVAMVLSHPLVMIGSDGSSMAPEGPAAATRPHPRSYGTFPRVLGHYVRDERRLDLPTAVRKMTGMPADQLRLRDRGRIARGKKADLVVFDAEEVRDEATFAEPDRFPSGIGYVLVNGQLVVDRGKHTKAAAGRVLRRA